jgi:hypothetical protein
VAGSRHFNSVPIGMIFKIVASVVSGLVRNFTPSFDVLTTGASLGTGTTAGGVPGAGAAVVLALLTSQPAIGSFYGHPLVLHTYFGVCRSVILQHLELGIRFEPFEQCEIGDHGL